MKDLGLIIACFACLEEFSQIATKTLEELLSKIMDNYSNTIYYVIIILLQGMV